jgi:acid stress-induced BolA-like protein IbaG/YrbA
LVGIVGHHKDVAVVIDEWSTHKTIKQHIIIDNNTDIAIIATKHFHTITTKTRVMATWTRCYVMCIIIIITIIADVTCCGNGSKQ